ncbi:hypothetical protein C6497_17170 [Candidatus Poribacteria bacterium]|nr:MAG: hypothetical protein C6497_17170 [Candidatus Poribacteria bacterium]
MKQYSRFIIIGLGLLAFFSYALPWKHTYSGIVLVNGPGWLTTLVLIGSLFILGLGIFSLKRTPVNPRSITLGLLLCGLGPLLSVASIINLIDERMNFITISFASTIVVIVCSVYLLAHNNSNESLLKRIILTCSIVGLACFIILVFSSRYILNAQQDIDNTKYGAFLFAICYILIIIRLIYKPEKEIHSDSAVDQNPQEDNIVNTSHNQ